MPGFIDTSLVMTDDQLDAFEPGDHSLVSRRLFETVRYYKAIADEWRDATLEMVNPEVKALLPA